MADAVRAEATQAPTAGVVAAGQHEREGIHREGPWLTCSVGEEEPTRIAGWFVTSSPSRRAEQSGPPSLEIGQQRGRGHRLQGEF